jgi:hypothetical protein
MSADMPDARASRKRQIQITPRLFRGAGSARGACATRDLTSVGVFSLCICPTRRVDRVKLIRYRRRADSIPRESRFRIAARNRRICRTSINAFRSREMPGFHHLSPVFLPWLGVRRRWDARRGLRPHAMSLVPCLYYRCEIACGGFGEPAFDSMQERCAGGYKPLAAAPTATIGESIGTIRKYRMETMVCRKTSITSACYLCNTLRKRGRVWMFEVVPLLRVQKSSVIVIERRRGASRGRPVLGGSLKSTHATRSR